MHKVLGFLEQLSTWPRTWGGEPLYLSTLDGTEEFTRASHTNLCTNYTNVRTRGQSIVKAQREKNYNQTFHTPAEIPPLRTYSIVKAHRGKNCNRKFHTPAQIPLVWTNATTRDNHVRKSTLENSTES